MKGFEDKIKRNIKWIFWGLLILGLFLGIKLIFEIKQFETKILSEREKLYYMKYLISYKVPVKKGFVMSDFKKGLNQAITELQKQVNELSKNDDFFNKLSKEIAFFSNDE